MSVIKLEKFSGMAPSANPQYIRDDLAVMARNTNIRFQDLRPAVTPVAVGDVIAGNTLYKFAGSSTFITKSGDVDFVRGQIPNDATERTYFTGDGAPKAIDTTLSVRSLGVPCPASAPVVTKTVVPIYTTDDAQRAFETSTTIIYEAVKAQIGYVYKGLADADLTDVTASPRPWEYSIVRSGSIVSGTFVLTNQADNCLISSDLEYVTDNTSIKVPLFVRGIKGQTDDFALATTLANISSPDFTQPTAKMINGDDVTVFVDAIKAALSSRDDEWGQYVAKLKVEKEAFMSLLSSPSSVTSAVAGIAVKYYATSGATTALNAAIDIAAQRVVDTAVMNGGDLTLTDAAAVTAINGFISVSSTGTKVLDSAAMIDWIHTKISPIGAAEDVSYFYRDSANIAHNLDLEIGKLALKATETTANISPSVSVTSMLVERQAAMESIVKYMELIAIDTATTRVMAAITQVFNTNIAKKLPPGVNLIISDRAYVVTEVTDWDEESKPSAVSNIVSVNQNDISTVAIPATAGTHTTKKRIYRGASGSTTAAFLFHSEIDASVTSVTDTLKDSDLNEVCPTFGWDMPLSNLKGLAGMPNGIMLGFTDNTLHACEPFHPYAWPATYDIPIEYPIVGIAVAGQTALVTTTGVPYLVTGIESASLSAEKMPINQSCIAKRSMVSIGGAVVYASPDGLVLVEGGAASIITDGYLSKHDWQGYNPSSIFAAEYEGRYCAFYTKSGGEKGCLVFDFGAKSLVEYSVGANAAYADKSTDTLYILDGAYVKNFFPESGTNLTITWKSKNFVLPSYTAFAWLCVEADFGSVDIEIYADGNLFKAKTIADSKPVRLPAGRFKNWQIQIQSSCRVTRVVIASSTGELRQVPQ